MNEEVEKYIARFDHETKTIFLAVRKIILEASPMVLENLWANMPTYQLYNQYIRIVGFNHSHINVTFSKGIDLTKSQDKYRVTSKGMIQIHTNDVLDVSLIKELVNKNFESN